MTVGLRFRSNASLVVGDLAIIVVLLTWGTVRHHGLDVLTDVGYVGATLAPFLIGWAIMAPIGGVYDDHDALWAALAHLAGAWVGAVIVGASLRATALFHGGATPIFVVVVAVTVGVALVGWRVVAEYGTAHV
jgi:hypothetical protein